MLTSIHSLILVITIILAFWSAKTDLANYDLQISAALFLILFLVKKAADVWPDWFSQGKSRLLESVIFTLVVTLTVISTGGAGSPFFFLIYFLLFSLSLILEPLVAITTSLTFVIFFLISLPPNQDLTVLLPIFSLAFLTPFALYLGQKHLENHQLKKNLASTQEQTLLFLSLMIKNHLKGIKQAIDNFVGDHQLHQIKDHARAMEKLIDKFENSSQ
jgi:hypothetical protein